MAPADVLETLLRSYQRYYNIEIEGVEPPFVAEAVFHSHDEQYFLSKRAKLSESDDHEYVFFATCDSLELADAQELERIAWERGLSRVRPSSSHRSTVVALVILAGHIAPEAKRYIQAIKRSKNYRFMLHGWSSFRTIALETSSGSLTWNRRGRDLKKLFRNIQP